MNYFIISLKEKYFQKKGRELLISGKLEKAFSYFQKAVLLNDSTDNIFNLALSLLSLSKYSEAEKYFKKIYQDFPDNEINILSLAECLIMQRKWDEAIDHYRILVEKKPQSEPLKAYLAQAEDVVAREKYVKSKELFYKAQIEIRKKNDTKALEYLLEAEEYDPKNPNTLNNIGSVLLLKKEFKKAYGYFEKAVVLAPQNKKFQKNLLHVKRKLRK